MKVIWLDTETTGTDSIRHDIWQVAYIVTDNGKEIYRNTIECQPYTPWTVDPQALAIGITMEGRSIAEAAKLNYPGFMKPWHAVDRFIGDMQRFLDRYNSNDKAAIGGFNVVFDLRMLSWWVKKSLKEYGLGCYTDYTLLDAAPLMRTMRHFRYIDIEDTKLSTICRYYDITVDISHNAMSDTEAAMNVFPCALNDFREMLNQPQYFGQLTAGEIS